MEYSEGSPRVTSGPPDRWYPGDPPDLDYPPECKGCGHEFTDDDVEQWLLELEDE